MIEQIENQQKILRSSPLNQRLSERFNASIESESIVMQQHWEHFSQIEIANNCVIVGQIINISTSGVGFQTAYNFDIIEPIPVVLSLAYNKNDGSAFVFDTFKVEATIVRSVELNSSFSFIGVKFKDYDEDIDAKLSALIANIAQAHDKQ